MYDLTDDMKRYLTPQSLARAAEMMAIPHIACHRRDCRRQGRCAWYFRSGEPCCLGNLDATERQAFDDMARRVARAWWTAHRSIDDPMTSPYREERALEDAAMEAIRPLFRHANADMRAYRRLLRRRAKAPPPHRDGHEPRHR